MKIHELLEYDAWATGKLLRAVESLTPEQFVHEFAGSMSSVRQQFFHLLSVVDRYRARLAGDVVPDISPEEFATPQELIAYAAQVRFRLHEFADGLMKEELNRVHEHETRKGVFCASVEQTL